MEIQDLNSIGPVSTYEMPPEIPEEPLQALVPFESTVSPWPPRLAFDIAMGEPAEEAAETYGLTPDDLFRILQHPAFRREVAEHAKEIRDNGLSFKQKAKIMAEAYLEDVDHIVSREDVAATIKLDAIKSVVKWAGLEPQASKDTNSSSTPQFNIQINL